ncbi:diacylglycerol acyltransferase type 2B [Umbelopsis sp. AD052]|nr:diacylglycerol acyltransferase type 2B [Umbelopsis sp. AD052]
MITEHKQQPLERAQVTALLDHIPKVHWAPLRGIPLRRRLQTFAIVTWLALLPICLIIYLYLFTNLFLWPLLIMYTIWLFFDKAPENGGRRISLVRKLPLWRYFASYFPVTLVKEGDLDPKGNYVMSYHPHGIISMAAFANFATEATGFSELYPGIVPSLLTLASNFRLPLYRDFMMSLGMCSVSRHSCEGILRSGPGRSIVIVTGGASESLSARPGTNDLTLKKRLGFIRLAIRNGASLVPIFSFGENDIYEQYDNKKGSLIWRYQKWFQKITGFTVPLAHARGIFNYNAGFIPFRHPIVTVVGKPIAVPPLPEGESEPSEEQLRQVQALYIESLQAIYDKYKDTYAKDRIKEMTIIA